MVDLLIRLEYRRRLLRRRMLRSLGVSGYGYFAIAGMLVFLAVMVWPVSLILAPVIGAIFVAIVVYSALEGIALLSFGLMGAPVGLVEL
jgi:hypothetical protein